jgi:hypothetical protein
MSDKAKTIYFALMNHKFKITKNNLTKNNKKF